MATSDSFVKFDKVDKSYDGEILVVQDLNVDIPKGEFLTMLGPSGSGKTTTLMMLAGFETPTGGEIYLDGEAIKPGSTADDVAQKFWSVLDKYGIKKESRTGYSIGIGYPPDWGEQTLNISKGDKTVLQPNVTFHMIAVMQFGDWGVEASESVRVTEKGSELFCNLSRELHIKG